MIPRKTRFAPSPTGLIHIGNARTALFSWLGGDQFLLRIEDTDPERSRREFVESLLEDLRWLGLTWDDGPHSPEPDVRHFQSRRGELYGTYYAALEAAGTAYPCFCSPQELEIARKVQLSSGQPPRYTGKCARLSPAEAEAKRANGLVPTLRFRVPRDTTVSFADLVRGDQHFETNTIGDFIIRRADGSSAFFFCNAIDDALMGVTHVLRGDDHIANTPRQIMLLEALHLPVPSYGHFALVLGDDGAPLSKRNGSRSIQQLREEGFLPSAVLNALARLGHHYGHDRFMSPAELRSEFDLAHVGKSPARFDPAHLRFWQHEAVRASSDDALWSWLGAETQAIVPPAHKHAFLEIARSNCAFPNEAEVWAKVLFTDEFVLPEALQSTVDNAGEAFFLAAMDAVQAAPEHFDAFMERLKATTGAKGKGLFQPLRAALTGRLDGPEIAKVYDLMDPQRRVRRFAEFTYSSE